MGIISGRVRRFVQRNRGRLLSACFDELIGRSYSKPLIRKLTRDLFQERHPKRWAFIIGCYNSGTTILRDLLGAHPAISILPREGVRFTDEFPDLQAGGWQRMLLKNEAQWLMDDSDAASRRDQIIKDWSPLWKKHSDIYLEKSIEHAVRMRWLERAFESPYFITIIRNGYCVCEGVYRKASPQGEARAGIGSKYPMALIAEQWLRLNQLIESQSPLVRHVYGIQYEELVADPVDTLTRLFNYLSVPCPYIDHQSGQLTVGKHIFRIDNRNPESISRLSNTDIREITPIIRSAMKHFGYPILESANSG